MFLLLEKHRSSDYTASAAVFPVGVAGSCGSTVVVPIHCTHNTICDTITRMAQGNAILMEIHLAADGAGGRITCPAGMRPVAGQYLAAFGLTLADPLPLALFATLGDEEEGSWSVAAPLPPHWTAGTALTVRGPLGNGFSIPPMARRIVLAAFGRSPARLLPLIPIALAQRAAVALYTDQAPSHLPAEVEILPPDLLPEARDWADYIALDIPAGGLAAARAALGLGLYGRAPCTAQALVTPPMPCTGLGECGACALLTRNGWKLACADGPVFDFNLLESV